jgi:signal transduction histidine kinase
MRADRTRVKFTLENGREWIAEGSREDAAGFCVGDTGIGIPESGLEPIFEGLHQVGAAGAAKEGSGLVP